MTEEVYNKIWKKVDTYKNEFEFRSDLGDLALSEIPDLTIREFGLIYNRAWSEGHASGYHEVLIIFYDLLRLVKELYSIHNDYIRIRDALRRSAR